MDIVIENMNSNIIREMRINTIKRLTGLFDFDYIFREISNIDFNKVILDITAVKNCGDINIFKSLISFINPDNLILVVASVTINDNYLEELINLGIYNFAYNSNHIKELYQSPNVYEDAIKLINGNNRARIIGIKNVTKHAGATSLTYILKKHLKKEKKVLALEIDRLDFNFFYDKEIISIPENKLEIIMKKYYNSDIVILIDVNESKKAMDMCDEILYLIEPTMLKINQVMMVDPTMFQNIKDKKIILNRSPLDNNDIKEFEVESHLHVFYNLPTINERQNNNKFVIDLIKKLNL